MKEADLWQPRRTAGNRYAHDLAQAESMRRPQSSERSRLSTDKKELTADDFQLALRGLEQAEAQRDQGHHTAALRLYELSLEILILFLKDESKFALIPNVEPATVAAQVSVALSDAEALKKARSPKTVTTITAATPVPQSSLVSGMIASLTSALRGNTNTVSPNTTTATKSSSKPASVPGVKRNMSQKSVKSVPQKGNTLANMSKPPSQQGSPGESTTNSKSQSSPRTIALRLGDPAKDQLYRAVLDDLYVPPEQIQKTGWDDIAGLEEVKQSLQESAILPLVRPDLFTGLRKSQNVLLFGPPGTGKTLLVRAVAKESGSALFACSASSLTSKWMGEAEKMVKALFQVALEISPSIIFLDEVDAVLSARKSDGEHEASRRLKTEFMIQMEGIAGGGSGDDKNDQRVLVLACTNCPWDIDPAVLRRFPRRIFVPLPDAAARRALLKILLQKAGKHGIKKKVQRDALVQRLDGFSCSDITAIASEASFGPIRALGGLAAVRGAKATDVRPINSDDFEEAIRRATKSVTAAQLQKFETWRKEQSAN